MKAKALLFDTRSIQRYIFSSNHLKTNIGASSLVDNVFRSELITTLRDVLGKDQVDAETWEKVQAPDWLQMPQKCRVGYIGGGNALVLFRDDLVSEDDLRKIVKEFTASLLQSHPGLRTGAAFGDFWLDDEGRFLDENGIPVDEQHPADCLAALIHKLKQWQSSVFPEVNVPYTGLTLLCPEIGEAATRWDGKDERFLSWEVMAKREAGEAAKGKLLEKLQSALSPEEKDALSQYAFPDELNKLGQQETESYIAIVHIDGNNMGEKFANCKTLTERKNLSIDLSRKTTKAFASMLLQADKEYASCKDFLDRKFFDPVGNGRHFLPIRPLVLGGDDLTFICTAKLALRYAKRVMDAMMAEGVDTCAGISIQPQNYPFFRGYMLAEQACDAAKGEMRALRKEGKAEKSCWLDFVIRHGEQAPNLAQIREQEYQTHFGSTHFGPYRVDVPESDERALINLTSGLTFLKSKEKGNRRLAMNKIKKLRDVIQHGGQHEWEKFRQRLEERSDALPKIKAWSQYEDALWQNGKTPYIDVIEMLDFYEPEGGKPHGGK